MMKTLFYSLLLTTALFHYVELCTDDQITEVENAHPECLQTMQNSIQKAMQSTKVACSVINDFLTCVGDELSADCKERMQQDIDAGASKYQAMFGHPFKCHLHIGSKAGLKEASLLCLLLSACLTFLNL